MENWWRSAVIYQVYPRSFQDSNGDGEGDLQGVISRIPYLASLGVDAIWLSPFYTSPNRDGGYDVSNPRDVDPRFGNIEDAKELIDTAHKNSLKVIFDIVPNHFSSEHPWFKAALQASPNSAERARFHFYDGKGVDGSEPPNNWPSVFSGSCWSRITESDGNLGQWYLHLFDSSQPDLNWNNPDVRKDFESTLRFWLDIGVDGFRIDVAHGLAKDDITKDHRDPEGLTKALRIDDVEMEKERRIDLLSDIPFFDRPGVHEIFREWRKLLDQYPEKMTVGEAFIYPTSKLAKYVRSDELHQIFNFDFLLIDWNAQLIRESIDKSISEVEVEGALPTWCLNNHDSSRVVTRLGSADQARALALIAHALPGSIYIYQGEELGLVDGKLPPSARQDPMFIRSGGKELGRDGARVPLPWSSQAENFGFTTGRPWLPQDPEYKNYAVDFEESDPASFLNLYRTSLALRKQHMSFNEEANLEWEPAPAGILVFKRGKSFTVVSNTTDQVKDVELHSAAILLHQSKPGASITGSIISVPAHTTLWLQL